MTWRAIENIRDSFNRRRGGLLILNHKSCLPCCLGLLALFALALSSASRAAEDINSQTSTGPSYELGHGLPLANTGFTLGGYTTAEYNHLKDTDPRLTVSHASMFLWWEGPQNFKFFSEVDFENAVATSYQTGDLDARYLSLERLYIDYALNDSVTLRAGKFLTPIGRWNLIHADPLVWTTSRPLVTQSVFPDTTTGIMATGVRTLFTGLTS